MRSNTKRISLLLAGISLWLTLTQAKAGDDLVLPPDFRVPAAVSGPAPALKPKASKAQSAKAAPVKASPTKTAIKKKPPAQPETPEPAATAASKTEKPVANKIDDDPVSFGMQWSASDHTNGGPGSLSDELNKNVNGAAVGTGAEVGFKYKF